MATRKQRSRRAVRPLIPARAPSPQAQELLAQVRRLRVRARVVAAIGVMLVAAGFAAVVAADGVPLLAILLPAGVVIAVLADRRRSRVSEAEPRVHRRGGGALSG